MTKLKDMVRNSSQTEMSTKVISEKEDQKDGVHTDTSQEENITEISEVDSSTVKDHSCGQMVL